MNEERYPSSRPTLPDALLLGDEPEVTRPLDEEDALGSGGDSERHTLRWVTDP